jgi:hypothetical protein
VAIVVNAPSPPFSAASIRAIVASLPFATIAH